MSHWTVDAPATLEFDGVAALRVRVISGSVAVLSTDDRPRIDVAGLDGQPLLVRHEAGILTITYPDLTWDGVLGWLRPQAHSAAITVMVPKECPTQLGVVNAAAVVSGVCATTSVKSVSGKITLDGMTGAVDATTLSGDVEAQGLDGRVAFNSVSGDLTVADAVVERLDAKTISGRVTADIDLCEGGALRVATVSGDVAIRLPAEASTVVDLRSTTGRVQSEFGGLDCAQSPGARTITGTLGSGDAKLSVTTMSGQVTLLERNHRKTPPGTGGAGTEKDAS
jgi:Putative adhesin